MKSFKILVFPQMKKVPPLLTCHRSRGDSTHKDLALAKVSITITKHHKKKQLEGGNYLFIYFIF